MGSVSSSSIFPTSTWKLGSLGFFKGFRVCLGFFVRGCRVFRGFRVLVIRDLS